MPPRPRVYWLNADADATARVRMNTMLCHSTATHIRVPAHDAHLDFAGNTTRAHTLSHVRALQQVARDARAFTTKTQTALVAEDTLSYEYTPWWTTPLARVLEEAPADWGALQLAFTCDNAHTTPLVHRMLQTHAPQTYAARAHDTCYVERAIAQSVYGRYVPWTAVRTGGTCLYAVNGRGCADILGHVRAYKHDPNYPRPSPLRAPVGPRTPPRFHPDLRAAELFGLTKTYVYHVPLFCAHADAHADADAAAAAETGALRVRPRRWTDLVVQSEFWRLLRLRDRGAITR